MSISRYRKFHAIDPDPGFEPEAALAPPVAIGGVGGSGTRVVAHIFRELGFHLGEDLNYALDNLWFTILFRRSQLPGRPRREREIGIGLFEKAMRGDRSRSEGEAGFLRAAAAEAESRLRAARPDRDPTRWPNARTESMQHARGPEPEQLGWGWKEPSTYVFLEDLARQLEGMRYIHVIRNGLEMARKPLTHYQLALWGERFGISPPRGELPPGPALRFWIRSNQRALTMGEELLGGRFLLVRYESLCGNPRAGIEEIARFVGAAPNPDKVAELAGFVAAPAASERDPAQDAKDFAPEDIAAVQALGFSV